MILNPTKRAESKHKNKQNNLFKPASVARKYMGVSAREEENARWYACIDIKKYSRTAGYNAWVTRSGSDTKYPVAGILWSFPNIRLSGMIKKFYLHPLKSIYIGLCVYILTEKGTESLHLWFPQKNSLMKRRAAALTLATTKNYILL